MGDIKRLKEFYGILSKEAGEELERNILKIRKLHRKMHAKRHKKLMKMFRDWPIEGY